MAAGACRWSRARRQRCPCAAAGGRVQALALKLIGNRQHVAGRDHDDVGLEVGDQLHLPLGLSAAKGHHRQAQLLSAIVRAQAAGEQAVAIAHMHHVARPRAAGADAARHHVGPGVDVVLRVAHHRGLACGAAGRMDAHALLARHGKHAERVAVAQVLLGGEGELRQIGQAAAVVGVHARRIELGAVDGGVGIGVRSVPCRRLSCRARNSSMLAFSIGSSANAFMRSTPAGPPCP
jgi:hypothetical protein